MGSFKFKLVLWFALLALLPLAIAFYGYHSLAKPTDTRRADDALRAARVRVGPIESRGLETAKLPGGGALAALTPQHRIDAAARASERTILVALLASLVLFGIATYLLGHSIVRTLARLVDAANAIAQGRLGGRVDVRGRDQIAQFSNAVNRMAATLERRLAEVATERRPGPEASTP